jgi:hypothetical protein
MMLEIYRQLGKNCFRAKETGGSKHSFQIWPDQPRAERMDAATGCPISRCRLILAMKHRSNSNNSNNNKWQPIQPISSSNIDI